MLSENTDVGWDALRAGSCKAAQTTQWLRRDFKDLFYRCKKHGSDVML